MYLVSYILALNCPVLKLRLLLWVHSIMKLFFIITLPERLGKRTVYLSFMRRNYALGRVGLNRCGPPNGRGSILGNGTQGWVRFLISDGADTRLLTKETDAGQLIVFRIDVPNLKTITPMPFS